MTKAARFVPTIMMALALSLSMFTLWTSPSLEEEQLQKQNLRRRKTYQLAGGAFMPAGVVRGNERITLVARRSRLAESYGQQRNAIVAPNLQLVRAPQPSRDGGSTTIPEKLQLQRVAAEKPQANHYKLPLTAAFHHDAPMFKGRHRWRTFVLSLLALTIFGAFVAVQVVNWYQNMESLPLLYCSDDDDDSEYSTGIVYSKSPSEVGYGYGTITVPSMSWTGDSFDKFDL